MTAARAAAETERLLERGAHLEQLGNALAGLTRTGRGHLVLLAGEAGIGKTSLVQAFGAGLRGIRLLSGACEPLGTARPLGPLEDIAAETGGELAERVESCAHPNDVLQALFGELRRRSPSVVVLEDLHWADEATLDLLRLLARRVAATPALVVATYRDDELDRHHPLRVALGQLSQIALTRMKLPPLSRDAIAELADPFGGDADKLYSRTGGNPFYVTEALAAGGTSVPDSVRDAVLARVAGLSDGARRLLDAVAITPPRAELALLETIAESDLPNLEECLASGMLRNRDGAVSFRHEIARVAVADSLAPDRALALNRAALAALAGSGRRIDLARLAHHAEAAADEEAVLRYARAAGERAAAVGAHREAAAQLARALRFADGLAGSERAALLERRSFECYLTAAIDDAIDAARQALAEHEANGDRLREGNARRWLSRLCWYAGNRASADREGRAAVELLEQLEPGVELAMAYSNLSQLAMLESDVDATRHWGGRAVELGESLGETRILVHTLNNVGSAELDAGVETGRENLRRSLDLARTAGLDDDVARAHTNLAAGGIARREYDAALRHLAEGMDYCREREMWSYMLYLTGWRARAELDQGRWASAAASATEVLDDPGAAAPSRILPLVVLGLVRARGGEPDVWEPLDEALALAESSGELQRLWPVAAARAEARWLSGETDLVAQETGRALALARERGNAWAEGELRVWRQRAGATEDRFGSAAVAEPYRLELAGDRANAARLWARLGCPYEAAVVHVEHGDETELRASLAELQRLGARPAAARVARRLRERGARDLARGPRASTRRNPAGLTVREVEVLQLLAEGLQNAHIAERLVLSAKTVDHHVSAILRKLRAGTRTEAAALAARLGLLDQQGAPLASAAGRRA